MMLLILTIPSEIGSALKLYKIKGEVTVNSGNLSKKAVKRQSVLPTDVLIIPRNSSVAILDDKSNRIYESLTQGKIKVEDLIKEAKSNASAVTKTTNDLVLGAIAENAKSKASGIGIPGVSVHVANSVVHAPVDLPESVSYLSYLRGLGEKEEYNDAYDAILVRRDINYDDETFKFAVFNTLSQPLYFNIIQQRTDREPELFFLDNPLAAPRTQTLVEEYLYILPDYPDGYIVVASDKDFTIADVKKLLDPSYDPEANFYFTLLRK